MVNPAARGLAALWLALAPAWIRAQGPEPAAAEAAPAEADLLGDLPARPRPPVPVPNVAWEHASAVTLVSLPFTAFWSLLGALAVGGIAQGRFPPEVDTPLLAGAAAVAGAGSLAIGLASVRWGGPARREAR